MLFDQPEETKACGDSGSRWGHAWVMQVWSSYYKPETSEIRITFFMSLESESSKGWDPGTMSLKLTITDKSVKIHTTSHSSFISISKQVQQPERAGSRQNVWCWDREREEWNSREEVMENTNQRDRQIVERSAYPWLAPVSCCLHVHLCVCCCAACDFGVGGSQRWSSESCASLGRASGCCYCGCCSEHGWGCSPTLSQTDSCQENKQTNSTRHNQTVVFMNTQSTPGCVCVYWLIGVFVCTHLLKFFGGEALLPLWCILGGGWECMWVFRPLVLRTCLRIQARRFDRQLCSDRTSRGQGLHSAMSRAEIATARPTWCTVSPEFTSELTFF